MPAPLLDREFLEKLERLTIHWQKSFAGLVGGHNASRFSGAGQELDVYKRQASCSTRCSIISTRMKN